MKSMLVFTFLILSSRIFAQDPPEKYQKIWMDVNEGDPSKAIKELKKIAKKEPKDPWPYWMLGIATFNGQESEERTAYFRKSFEADPNFAPAHYNYATCLDVTDQAKQAEIEEHYTKAIVLDSTNGFYYVARAGLYQEQEKYDQAIADAEKAKKIDAENVYFPNKIIVECLHAEGKSDELKKFLKDAFFGGGPEDPDFYYLLGTIYESFANHSMACLAYAQAVTDQEFIIEMFGSEEDFKNPEWFETAQKKSKGCK